VEKLPVARLNISSTLPDRRYPRSNLEEGELNRRLIADGSLPGFFAVGSEAPELRGAISDEIW
jgi:hypothetical protein